MSVKVFVLTLRQLKIGLNEIQKREREITTDTTYYSREKKKRKGKRPFGFGYSIGEAK